MMIDQNKLKIVVPTYVHTVNMCMTISTYVPSLHQQLIVPVLDLRTYSNTACTSTQLHFWFVKKKVDEIT